MDVLGQPQELLDVLKSTTDRIRPDVGDNRYRILYGPVRALTVFIPTRVEGEDGTLKSVKFPVIVPRNGHIFEELAAIDKRIKAEMGDKEPRSSFYPASAFAYLGFDRSKAGQPPKVEIIEVKKTVAEGFTDLETRRSKDNTKLLWGPIYTFDSIVTKTQDPSKDRRYGTKYKTAADPENAPLMGKVSVEHLKLPVSKFFEIYDRQLVFTDEETEAIKNCTIKLPELLAPKSPEAILETLLEHPIDVLAIDNDGKRLFPNPDALIEALKRKNLEFFSSPIAALPPADNARVFADNNRNKVEDTIQDAQVVEDQVTDPAIDDTMEKLKADMASTKKTSKPNW